MTQSYYPETPRERGDESAPHVSPVTPVEDLRTIAINTLSWSAVFAGVVLALAAHLIFNMIGVGAAAIMVDPLSHDLPSASSVSVGAAAWWALSGIVASLVGGYVAGRLAGRPKPSTAAMHGLTAWAFTALLTVLALTTALGGLAAGSMRWMATTAPGTLSTSGANMAENEGNAMDPFTPVEGAIRSGIGGADPATLRDSAVSAIRIAVMTDPSQAQGARQRAAEALARAANIPVNEAQTQVQQYEQQYRATMDQMQQEARQVAARTQRPVSMSALLSAAALLLGALAGWFGGWMGAVAPTVTSRRAHRDVQDTQAPLS